MFIFMQLRACVSLLLWIVTDTLKKWKGVIWDVLRFSTYSQLKDVNENHVLSFINKYTQQNLKCFIGQ